MKRIISLMLCCMLLVSLFIGCSSSKGSDDKEKSTEIVLYQFKLEIAKQLDAAAKKYMEKTRMLKFE